MSHPLNCYHEEFTRVQNVIAKRNNSQPHHIANDAFPVRGLVRCPSCWHPLTGAFSRGRRQRYAYYRCYNGACTTRTRSYATEDVNQEFVQFLRELAVPAALGWAAVAEVRAVAVENREAVRLASKTVADGLRAFDRELTELISMRTARLISDAEFIMQRRRLEQRRQGLQGTISKPVDEWLSDADARGLVESLQNIDGLWRATPLEQKRGFEQLILPVGYVLGNVRTAELGPLFKTFAPSGEGESNVAAFVKPNLNRLMIDITKFLALVRGGQGSHDRLGEAA